MSRLLIWSVLVLTGCLPEVNPCPNGFIPDRAEERCVSAPVDGGEPTDAPEPWDGSLDAGPSCSEQDVEAWGSAHGEAELVANIVRCSTHVDVPECVADWAGVEDCRHCAQPETECAMDRCFSACSNGTDEDCRGCLCEGDCVRAFESCAGRSTGLCGTGELPPPADLRLPAPLVVRRKAATGFFRTTFFYPDDPDRVERQDFFGATGMTATVPLSVNGVDYLFEVMDACPHRDCPVRLTPVLAAGTLATPVFQERWGRGWDVFTTFEIEGATFLFAYKSGQRTTQIEPSGAGRILQIGAGGSIDRVFDGQWSPELGPPGWHQARAFAVGTNVYLAQYRRQEPHGVEIHRVRLAAAGDIEVLRVSEDLAWEAAWDVVDTFPIGRAESAQWFALQYRRQADAEPALARISRWLEDESGEPTLSLPIWEGAWPDGLTAVHPFRTAATTTLLRRNQTTGWVDFLRLPTTVEEWSEGSGEVVLEDGWGTSPAWNAVGVARARLWEEP